MLHTDDLLDQPLFITRFGIPQKVPSLRFRRSSVVFFPQNEGKELTLMIHYDLKFNTEGQIILTPDFCMMQKLIEVVPVYELELDVCIHIMLIRGAVMQLWYS